MHRSDRISRGLAIVLAALAGYVDAIGFISMGGFFVSFMSGNTTRAAVAVAEGSSAAFVALNLILHFVLGVMLGSTVGRLAHRQSAVLGLVAVLLAVAAGAGLAGKNHIAIGAMALAMGAENTIFERGGEVQIGLTYMTGTLVKFGQHLTSALFGGDRWAWAPYLLLWLGLAAGAVTGALAYPRLGFQALWPAALAALALAFAFRRTTKAL